MRNPGFTAESRLHQLRTAKEERAKSPYNIPSFAKSLDDIRWELAESMKPDGTKWKLRAEGVVVLKPGQQWTCCPNNNESTTKRIDEATFAAAQATTTEEAVPSPPMKKKTKVTSSASSSSSNIVGAVLLAIPGLLQHNQTEVKGKVLVGRRGCIMSDHKSMPKDVQDIMDQYNSSLYCIGCKKENSSDNYGGVYNFSSESHARGIALNTQCVLTSSEDNKNDMTFLHLSIQETTIAVARSDFGCGWHPITQEEECDEGKVEVVGSSKILSEEDKGRILEAIKTYCNGSGGNNVGGSTGVALLLGHRYPIFARHDQSASILKGFDQELYQCLSECSGGGSCYYRLQLRSLLFHRCDCILCDDPRSITYEDVMCDDDDDSKDSGSDDNNTVTVNRMDGSSLLVENRTTTTASVILSTRVHRTTLDEQSDGGCPSVSWLCSALVVLPNK